MSGIKVEWDKKGSEFTYNVWYARNPKGPWIISNENILTDSNSSYDLNNEYVIDYLYSDLNYYVKVTNNDRYDSWCIGYASSDSTEEGRGHEDDAPLPPFGNTYGYKINVTI